MKNSISTLGCYRFFIHIKIETIQSDEVRKTVDSGVLLVVGSASQFCFHISAS
jgi:hypothetical protein